MAGNWVFPQLDNVTLNVASFMSTFVVTMWLLVAIRINRAVRGLPYFALGLLAVLIGSFFSILRVVWDSPMPVFVGNALIVGGVIGCSNGVRLFRGRKVLPRRALCLVLTVLAVPYLYYLFVDPVYSVRVAIISPLIATLTFDAAISMAWKVPRGDRVVYWLAAASFGFNGAVLTLRSVSALLGGYGRVAFLTGFVENAIAVLAAATWTGQALGMLLVSNAQIAAAAERASFYDPLTGLPNRRLLLNHLADAERRARTSGQRLGIVYLDLDGFKLVNDRLGHEAGDNLLRSLAAAMRRDLDPAHFLARIGGDEFVVLVPHPEDLDSVVEQLVATVAREHLPQQLPLGVSCGKAVFSGSSGTAREAMRAADADMYASKHARRTASPAK